MTFLAEPLGLPGTLSSMPVRRFFAASSTEIAWSFFEGLLLNFLPFHLRITDCLTWNFLPMDHRLSPFLTV